VSFFGTQHKMLERRSPSSLASSATTLLMGIEFDLRATSWWRWHRRTGSGPRSCSPGKAFRCTEYQCRRRCTLPHSRVVSRILHLSSYTDCSHRSRNLPPPASPAEIISSRKHVVDKFTYYISRGIGVRKVNSALHSSEVAKSSICFG